MRPPQSVRVVLDQLVETQALNSHWRLPRIRVGYGQHSEKEREWDHRAREQLVDEGVHRRHLVQLPAQQRDGLAELCGMSRRTAIRAGRWLAQRGLVHLYHEHGVHPPGHRLAGIGKGGCIAGGAGAATEWRPGVASAPEPPPERQPEAEGHAPRRSMSSELERVRADRQAPAHVRGP